MATGTHEISCPTWRPVGTPSQEFAAFFLGGAAALKTTEVVSADVSQRFRLTTTAAGSVIVLVNVITRHLEVDGP